MLPRRRLSTPWGGLAALGAVGVFAAWLTSPLWSTTDRVFAGKLSTDNVVTPWFYDFVARSWWSGAPMDPLSDFDFPAPVARLREFPDIADAMLAAPLAWALGWPAQWGATLSLAVALNGLGLAALARAAGCGGLGVFTAGALGVMLRPVWTDLVMGRLNVAFPGIVALSVAAMLASMPRDRRDRRGGVRAAWAAAAAGLGALAALIYPPFLLLLAPLGLLALGPLGRVGPRAALWPAAAIGAALWLVAEPLRQIYDSQTAQAVSCGSLSCPSIYNAVALADLARDAVEPRQGLSISGLVWPSWWLAPLALLHPRRRTAALLLVLVPVLLGLSLGPCPRLTIHEMMPGESRRLLASWLREGWCLAAPLHDYGRFASAAAVLLALLAGLGADALWQRRRLVAVAAVGGTLWQAGALVLGEILDIEKWHPVSAPVTAQFLQTAEPGPVAELPFDRSQQFLSVLYAPGSPRVNPLQALQFPAETRDPAIVWLFDLGWGRAPAQPVTRAALQETGLRWVFYDPGRCKPSCPPRTRALLQRTLGSPRLLQDGVLVWDLQAD